MQRGGSDNSSPSLDHQTASSSLLPNNNNITITTTTIIKTEQPIIDQGKSILEECEKKFSENDAITNPFIFDYLKQYIKHGGKPSTVVQMLSNSYKGYPQMTSLLCDWMSLTNIIDKETINKLLMEYLKNLIIEHFDSKKADAIFTATHDPPKWLEYMINQMEWRNLIYQLSERHPNCLMLNFAIQRISESGFHNEIASVTTATTSLRVFHRILTDAIEKLLNEDEEILLNSSIFFDFKKICCHSQYTYIYAQCLIRSLIVNNNKFKDSFIYLSEELENYALKEGKASDYLIRRIRYLFLEYDYRFKLDNLQQSMSEISIGILSMLNNNMTTPSDVLKLFKYYSGNNPPPVELLQSSDVLDLFIHDLFNPAKKINQVHRSKYIYILAYATSCNSEDDYNTQQNIIKPIINALEKTINICTNTTLPKSVSIFRQYLMYNIVCVGILHWIGIIFTDPQHSITVFTLNNTKMYMSLIKEIAFRHDNLSFSVLNVLKKCFNAKNDLDPLQAIEVKRIFLDVLIYLIQLGYVLPTLQTVHDLIIDRMDMSLIRHIINTIIELIEPPFSNDFVSKIVEILCIEHTRDALSSQLSSSPIAPFVQYLVENQHLYHLSIETVSTLQNFFLIPTATK
ncbi:hypothetical protein ABK040_003676 [Willaertia magna]